MNIYLFIESLSDSEKEEFKNYFLKQESAKFKEERDKNMARIPIQEFVDKNKMSLRLANILLYKDYHWDDDKRIEDGFYFKFADEICKRKFLRIRNAGIKSWKEVEKLLTENNLPIH